MITYSTPKKSYYFVWSEYSALVLIAEKPLNSFYIINPWISWELNIIERSPSPIIANHFVELLRLGFQQVFPSHSLPNFDSISLWGIPCLCIWLLIQRQKSYYFFLLEYSALVLIAEKPLNNFSIINPWISWELNIMERSPSPRIINHFVELLKLEFQQIFPSRSLPNFDSISL